MRKINAKLGILVSAAFLAGCATTDMLGEKFAALTGGSTKTAAEDGNGSTQSGKKKSIFDYATPSSYDEAYTYRTDAADKRALSLLKNKETDALRVSNPYGYVKKVCEGISAAAANDFEKAKLAHDVVCVLLSYDAQNFWAGTVPPQEYEQVLQTKTAVCEGYANLYKAFCDTLKIRCEKVHGYARGVGTSLENEQNPTESNHAWNLVKISEAWYLVDCTWDSGHMEGRTSKQDYTTDWLFLKPEHFIYSHYPDIPRQQLLTPPLTAAQFSAQPDLRPKFFEVTESHGALAKKTAADGGFSYAFDPKKGYEVSFRLADAATGQEAQNCTFVKAGAAGSEALFSLPAAGTYSVTVFWRKTGGKSGHGCGTFLLEAAEGSAVRYPTTFASSAQDVEIISPITMPLAKGKKSHFEVRAANKKFVAVICGKTFIQLTNDGKGNFSGDVEIPATVKEVTLSASNSERTKYEGLAKYTVE